MDITEYIDTAKSRSGATSDRALCRLLNISPNWVTHVKKGTVPTDETMLKLAEIAHIPPHQALLDLNIWRASGKAKAVYQALKTQALSATLSATLILLMPPLMSPAFSQTISNDCIYYGKRKRRQLTEI